MTFLSVENLAGDSSTQVVSLNRPDVKNAFHPGMIQEITETFHSLSRDPNLKLIILRGEGTAFCAGADLNWMKEMVRYSFSENVADSEKLWSMFEAVAFCSVPVIGVVHGAVFGGALGLVAACDYVFSETRTKFCFSEVKLGLAPAVISSFILRKVAEGQARALMLSADVFSTDRAQSIGLVHASFDGEPDLTLLTKSLRANGTEAMRETKKLLQDISTADWQMQKKLTTKVISERRVSAEGQERLKKFVDKV